MARADLALNRREYSKRETAVQQRVERRLELVGAEAVDALGDVEPHTYATTR